MRDESVPVSEYNRLEQHDDYPLAAAAYDSHVELFASVDEGTPHGLILTADLVETDRGTAIDVTDIYGPLAPSIGTVAWDTLSLLGFPIAEEEYQLA